MERAAGGGQSGTGAGTARAYNFHNAPLNSPSCSSFLVLIASSDPASGEKATRPAMLPLADVIRELNLARQNPAAMPLSSRSCAAAMNGNVMVLPGGTRIRTKEGTAALDDAIRFLRTTQPQAPWSCRPECAARRRITAPIKHPVDSDMPDAMPAMRLARISRYGTCGGSWGENISYGKSTARARGSRAHHRRRTTAPGSIGRISSIRPSILPGRRLAGTRDSGQFAAWTSPAATPNAVNRQRRGSSRGNSTDRRPLSRQASYGSRILCSSFGAHFFQNRLDGGIRSQQGGAHDFAEFPPGLSELVTRRLHRGIGHRFLMGRSQLRSLFFSQAGPAGAAFHSKLSRRLVLGGCARRAGANWSAAARAGTRRKVNFAFIS